MSDTKCDRKELFGACALYKEFDECKECERNFKEKKMCSNGQPCTHPNCKRCGTTHFMSECDYGKEQKE